MCIDFFRVILLVMPYRLMTIRFGELVNEAFIKWSCESCALLEEMNE